MLLRAASVCLLLLACTEPGVAPGVPDTGGAASMARVDDTAVMDVGGGNLVVILADDLGLDKLPTYTSHADQPSTPRIDALADGGVQFTTAYGGWVCSPARAMMLTGLYPSRTGVGTGIDVLHVDEGLADEEVTLAEILGEQGYDSSFVGKWHLDPKSHPDYGNRPVGQGFGWWSGTLSNVADYYDYYTYTNGVGASDDTYLLTRTIDDAIDRVGEMQEPWLLVVALHTVHSPFQIPPRDLYTAPTPDENDELAVANAMVEAMDTEVGRLLDALPSDSTVAFLADNGTDAAVANGPFASDRAKGTMYEGGLRVPFIVSAPWLDEPGAVREDFAHIVDVLPTLVHVASGTEELTYNGAHHHVDGRSLVGVIQGYQDGVRHLLFNQSMAPNFTPTDRSWVLRSEHHKLIRHEGAADELYELVVDTPDDGLELMSLGPLSGSHQDAYDDLRAKLDRIVGVLP